MAALITVLILVVWISLAGVLRSVLLILTVSFSLVAGLFTGLVSIVKDLLNSVGFYPLADSSDFAVIVLVKGKGV